MQSVYFNEREFNQTFTNDIKAKILNDPFKFGKYHIEGPQGIGKSFALMHLVLTLRNEPTKYRVLYVNNPQELDKLSKKVLANELFRDIHRRH